MDLLLSPQETPMSDLTIPAVTCGTCDGKGQVRWCSLCSEVHRIAAPYIGCTVGEKPCPNNCINGLVPSPEAIEAAHRAMMDYDVQVHHDEDNPWTGRGSATVSLLAAALTPGDPEQ